MPSQNISIVNGSSPGISFDDDPQLWWITFSVLVESTQNNGVYSNFANSTLENHGFVVSKLKSGVYFIGNNGVIDNYAGASISGSGCGVVVDGVAETINNAGIIKGINFYGVWLSNTSDQVVIHNAGSITGHVTGIRETSDHEGGQIDNTGKIHGDDYAIDVDTAVGLETLIYNDGWIDGTIRTNHGGIHLSNHGRLDGDIKLFAVNQRDQIFNDGRIIGDVYLGSGGDRFQNAKGGICAGGIYGEAGNDRLIGGNYYDALVGGLGKDTLTGGARSDGFVFNAVAESPVGAGHDVITDFSQAQEDHIYLGNMFPAKKLAFVGTDAFTGIGQVRYVLQDHAGTANDKTMVFANLDTDLAAEFQIEVKGLVHFVATDFWL